MERVYTVEACIVETEHNVALNAFRIVDEEIRNRRAVRDELRANALGRDLVLAVLIRFEGGIAIHRIRSGVLAQSCRREGGSCCA